MPIQNRNILSNSNVKTAVSPFAVLITFGTAIGAVLGFSIAFGIWAYPPFVTDNSYRDFAGVIATLIGAFVTLLAAGLTFWIVKQQIQESRHAYDDQIIRRGASARAFLPIDLAEFSRATEDCFKKNFATLLVPPPYNSLSQYSVPPANLNNIKNLIEFLSNENSIHFIDLINKYQIFSSRINSAGNGTLILPQTIISYCIDLLEISEIIDNAYPYSRGQTETIERTPQLHRMKGRVFFWAPNTPSSHPIYAEIERRFQV